MCAINSEWFAAASFSPGGAALGFLVAFCSFVIYKNGNFPKIRFLVSLVANTGFCKNCTKKDARKLAPTR